MQPPNQVRPAGGDRIAYQVLGDGPPDLVVTPGSFGHVDIIWEDPGMVLFFQTLASLSRLILFDRRGTGASDPLPLDPLPPWESYAEDLATVLDEVGSQRAALLAMLEAGPLALYFASTRPERTSALILANTTAKYIAADDYPIGVPAAAAEALFGQIDQLWGSEAMAAMGVPSRAGNERFLRWMAKLQRSVASPKAAGAFLRALFEVDVRAVLPLVQAPTLILHRRDLQVIPAAHGRYLAQHIPGARFIEVPGSETSLVWETPELILDHVEEFLTGARRAAEAERMLATVLFTDIVGSTEQVGRLGDRRWRRVLNLHDELARRLIEEAGGRLVKTTATAS